jgi:hypothetical protein
MQAGDAEMTGGSFIDRDRLQGGGGSIVSEFASNRACQTCMFARGEPSWDVPDGYELTPDKCFCLMYDPDDLGMKPNDIAFGGADCEFYEDAEAV